jgi:GNAT superfamily N-acetyltransferase
MPIIKTKTTYLEMYHPPTSFAQPPCDGIEITKADAPSTEFYRYLYRSVGEDLFWVDRLILPDDELRAIIQDDRVVIYVLAVGGETAGYSELDRRQKDEIELVYFGLFPRFVGRGLGKYFLDWTLRKAWAFEPRRVWVHTCDLDHPAALPTYLKAGFAIYDEEIIDQRVPDDVS